jgi:hypothetical protein
MSHGCTNTAAPSRSASCTAKVIQNEPQARQTMRRTSKMGKSDGSLRLTRLPSGMSTCVPISTPYSEPSRAPQRRHTIHNAHFVYLQAKILYAAAQLLHSLAIARLGATNNESSEPTSSGACIGSVPRPTKRFGCSATVCAILSFRYFARSKQSSE